MPVQHIRVIWGQCCQRVAASPCLPNGPIMQFLILIWPYWPQKSVFPCLYQHLKACFCLKRPWKLSSTARLLQTLRRWIIEIVNELVMNFWSGGLNDTNTNMRRLSIEGPTFAKFWFQNTKPVITLPPSLLKCCKKQILHYTGQKSISYSSEREALRHLGLIFPVYYIIIFKFSPPQFVLQCLTRELY